MINRLVRTELESYVHDLVVWGGPVFFFLILFQSFMWTVNARSGDPFSDLLDLFLLPVGLSWGLVAIKASRRNALEKRTRLFSQLPVSTREVSIASWWVRLLCLLVPTLACTAFIARAADLPFLTLPLIALAIYLGGTTLVAATSLRMGIRHLPSPMSVWAERIYIACALGAVAVWFMQNILVIPPFPFNVILGMADVHLSGLTVYLMVSSVALVALDIWLRDRADDYLG